MLEDPKVQAIATDARLFSDLVDQPGWRRLRTKFQDEYEEYCNALGRRLMNGAPIPQEEILWHRAWFQALEWFTGTPEMAMGNLEAAARRAYALAVLDLGADDDTSPPNN